MTIRRYSELRSIDNFMDRFRYLALPGNVGVCTFGFDRHINQKFYRSTEWRQVREHVIARDEGCDLGIQDHEIFDRILIHHINPMTVNAIHFGDEKQLPKRYVERRFGDTKLW